jgi:hypothetical protein
MRKLPGILIFLFVFFFESKGQVSAVSASRTDTAKWLVTALQMDGRLTTPAISLGRTSKQHSRFMLLLSMLSDNELYNLANEYTGCVRVYAFMGLLLRGSKHTKEVKKQLSSDGTEIKTMHGCIISKSTVSSATREVKQKWYQEKAFRSFLAALESDGELRNRTIEEALVN